MTRRIPCIAIVALAACSSREAADIVFKNGNVYTVNDKAPKAEAIAVKGDKIVYVGTNDGVDPYDGPHTIVVDLAGAAVYPGFADAHYHLIGVGEREMTLNLEGTTTKEAFLATVKERVATAKPGAWVTGGGWIETFWTPPVFPTRQDLDRIAPNNPVALVRADGHALIANSAALREAGITRATKDPPGGRLNRDARGELTGMLIDAAEGLIGAKMPAPSEADVDRAVVLGVKRSIELGWTEVQDAGGNWDDVVRFRRLIQDGAIKLRIYKAISGPGPGADSLIKIGPMGEKPGGLLTVRAIKVVFDGALGSRGAWLLEPYSDEPRARGLVTTDTVALRPMLKAALERGIQVETHAIGDAANRKILDLYEEALNAVPYGPKRGVFKEPRWRIEHAQIVNPADIPRFKTLGVIASMQPSHAIGDLYFAPARLGAARLEGAYAWNSFLKQGTPVAGGSDAPVERGEPMIEFYAAVTRKDIRGKAGPDGEWHPEQKVSREEALKMFTRYAAFAAFEDDKRGSIEVGKWADFTILDHDIMTIPEAEILTTKPVMTVIAGEIVHSTR
ncbi:MAG: amidohydrolase [Gemmatimonadota bacterium]